MKSRLFVLCAIMTLILMLPVLAHAETQLEFELGCTLKTASACVVHNDNPEGEVIASLPAGTYVRYKGSMDDGWVRLQFWHNGGRTTGWTQVKTVAAMSDVRNGNGMLDQVHELDPDYESKMQQGTAMTDVRAGWTSYENDPFTADLEHVSPEEAAARASQYATSGATNQRAAATGSTTTYGATGSPLGQLDTTTDSTSSASSEVTLRAKLRRVSGSEAPSDLLTAFVYAPNSGKASLREAADNDSKVLSQCASGTVVVVLEIGKTHSLVEINGQTGYLRNDCLGYSAVKEEQVHAGTLVGGGTINVRAGADKDSARIAQWPAGTQVTVYGVDGNWCEVEFDGQHGWVASKYVVATH